ncbi:hypothetical protein GGR51DRAFT_386114 [Nemania sp. FL0031]|nr:hypothetical protein GGR51DRAFT_386114 [Nemania sp. FL0031]
MVAHQGEYLVLVRKYRLSKTNVLVESPNVDLNAQTPRIIIRTLDGDYKGEPRVIDDATSLRDDIDKRAYRDITHGVYISPESDAGNFPIWVCLGRNSEHRLDKHISVLNLYRLEFSVVPIANICWVPSHKASNGDVHTIISDPGRRGYAKETFIPTVIQNIRFPEQAKFSHPPSSLPGFTILGQKRRMELYNRQLMSMQAARTPCLRRLPQLYAPTNQHSGLPWFVNDDLPSSDEENTNPCPLHRHSADRQRHFDSINRLHRIFTSHRLEHDACSPSSMEPRELHAYSTTESVPNETEMGLSGDVGIESLPDELQRLGDEHCFRDAERLQQITQDWSIPAMQAPFPNSGTSTPGVELLPDALDGFNQMGSIPELVPSGTIWGRRSPKYHDLRTPEPPEMLR